MANKRMFNITVIDTDLFLDMPPSTQALYFHLGMRADDDGFVTSPKSVARLTGCTVNDLNLLIEKGFLIAFDNGIVAIKHWKINNYIRGDRYHATNCVKEFEKLTVLDNGEYCLLGSSSLVGIPNDNQVTDIGIPSDNQVTDTGVPNDNHCQAQYLDLDLDLEKESVYTSCILSGKPDDTPEKENEKPLTVKQTKTEKEKPKKENPNKEIIKAIIDYLNEKARKNFKPTTGETIRLINARLREGYTLDHFKTVIDNKVKQWLNDEKYNIYLQPSTLFAPSKFENYLNEVPINKPQEEQKTQNDSEPDWDYIFEFNERESAKLLGNTV